jgi:acylphosphatase
MADDNVRAHALISGRVQGVAYRIETQWAAERIGVRGWVRNLPDGRVEAVFEGGREEVDEILEWCRRGPALARVDAVDVRWENPTGGFTRFGVTR